jgi:hypothetical protein
MAETLDVTSMLPQKFEPKRKSQFILQIEGIDAYLVSKTARPKVTTEALEIPFMNSRRYIAKETKFEEMAVTLHDPISPSGAQQIFEWLRLVFEPVSGRSGYADFYKRDIALKELDPIGTTVSLWEYKGAFITSADFGELEYGPRDMVDIALTIRYDLAILQF